MTSAFYVCTLGYTLFEQQAPGLFIVQVIICYVCFALLLLCYILLGRDIALSVALYEG